MRFDPKVVAASEWFTLDFTRQLAVGETLVTPGTTTVTVVQGVDATPGNMISGSAVVNGSKVSQLLIGGIAGVWYRFTFSSTTSNSQTLAETCDLVVR